MAIKLIHTGGPYGDCLCSYDVQLDHEYTVEEFVKEVLKEKPQEWGEVTVATDFKYIYQSREDGCVYRYGKIEEHFKKADTAKRTIVEMKAHGGWSTMNYFVKCK